MRNPAFLWVSRHGVFYLRYPLKLGECTAHVRLSLGTREPKEALYLTRCATAYADSYIAQLRDQNLKHSEIRDAVRAFFMRGIENARAQRAALGPLSVEKVTDYTAEADRYDEALRSGQHWDPAKQVAELASLISRLNLPIKPGTPDYEVLRVEHMRGWRDVARAVVAENKQLEVIDFTQGDHRLTTRTKDRLIEALWKEFREYGENEQRWTSRTIAAKEAHLALLIEILGANRSVRNIDRDDALRVRNILTRYPANRYKMPETRDEKVLGKLLDLPGVETMQWRTVNKYLGTYSGLFDWAEKNGRVDRSAFAGLALKAPKTVSEAPRRPFTVLELQQIKAILLGDVGLEPYRKWATLLAMHSGARQNEVCQLLVSDIVERDSILCMDIGLRTEGSNKKQLKNPGSARTVPIHKDVLSAGFLAYLDTARGDPKGLLFPALTYKPGMGYGRKVGQWFNGPLMKRIGLDGDSRVAFHSLRHSVAMLLRAMEVPEPRISAVFGHEQQTTTTAVYGGGFPVAILKAELDKMSI